MPTRKVAPSSAASQPQSSTNTPTTDLAGRRNRFSERTIRARGLSSALRILLDAEMSGALREGQSAIGPAYEVAIVLEMACDAIQADCDDLVHGDPCVCGEASLRVPQADR